MTAPIFETYDDAMARDSEPGDFMIVQTPVVGIKYTQATCFELVGCTVVCGSHAGATDGCIARVYRRLADAPAPSAPEAGAK